MIMTESLAGMMTILMDIDLALLMTGDMDMMNPPAGMMITMIDPLTGKIEECSVTGPDVLLEELEELDSLYSMEFVTVLELDIKLYKFYVCIELINLYLLN